MNLEQHDIDSSLIQNYPRFSILLISLIVSLFVTIINSLMLDKTRMKEISVELPAKNGQPDFEFMENYIKSVSYSSSI